MGGSKDRGDVGNVHTRAGGLVAVECRNESTLRIPQYLREAGTEAGHYGALCGVAVIKRRGTGMTPNRMGEQLVCMTLDDLVRLLLD
nr:MAG TPA: HOLLIDAY JUNCTION RESOLVASE HOMOLOGOUS RECOMBINATION [Caudoviricetes sp.]